MQVTKEPIDPCQVALTIEVEQDKVVHAVDKAYREYAKYVSIPGFRKGKAPLSFVRQRVPESDVRQRTAEILVEPAYQEALTQTETTPYAPPKLELVQLDLIDKPFIFKALVPLAPTVELGNYKGLQVTRNKFEMTEGDVDSQIERLRERSAEYPKVERAVRQGDLVIADVSALVDGQPDAEEPRPTMLEIGADNIPGFDEQIIGMQVDEVKKFSLTYPADYPEAGLAGKPADFTVRVKEVRAKQLPELDDALAQKITNNTIETFDAFKAQVRTDLENSLQSSAQVDLETKLVDQIVGNAKVMYPPVLVESEVEDEARQLMERLDRQGVTLDAYLQRTGKTREQLTEEFKAAAEKRIQIGLVLGEVAEKENLFLTDEDMNAAIAEQAEENKTSPAAMRAYLETNKLLPQLSNQVQTKKVLDFLCANAIIKDTIVSAGESKADAGAKPKAEKAPKKPAKRKASENE